MSRSSRMGWAAILVICGLALIPITGRAQDEAPIAPAEADTTAVKLRRSPNRTGMRYRVR